MALVSRTPAAEGGAGGHRATAWQRAREAAALAGTTVRARSHRVALAEAFGEVLATSLDALGDLPSFDTSAMDGWAVAGPGPWAIRPGDGVLAGGDGASVPLADGEAVRIATGARIPADTTAVIRSEHARESGSQLYATRPVGTGQDIRPRGQECRSGDPLLPAGSLVTPAVLGLAAAAGYDELVTRPRPRVEILVLGDELLTEGLPHDGLIRDALSPMLAPWITRIGAEVVSTRRLGDDPAGAEALFQAVSGSTADVVVTTGGTASGPVDHVHPVLRRAGAELLVDGVAVRPGHPMLLARIGDRTDGRHVVGLPGNPLAAVSGLLTLAEPLLRALAGRRQRPRYAVPVEGDVPGHPYDTRLVPVLLTDEHAVPLRYNGPAMLRGVAAADALAVVPPHGARSGQELEVLDLPWAAGGCFT
ncbi:molybdopterin molybdotransferase MoeA [Streptomyces sp. NPDC006670]|uniref:molybdopterin molybdotransferase MoeA n=1 Tax=Streptomyces sp. NPDC006670 TaxID=3154476 RepID=UPI00340BE369